MFILSFDTTNDRGGAAVYRDLECVASAANEGSANYSVTLFEMVDGLLARSKLRLRDIELFALANGPGSFTGIRVGVAAAQGWAKAFERPVCSVSVLAAMVEEARPEADMAVPILDARRAEFYVGSFRRAGSDFALVGGAVVLKAAAARTYLESLAFGERAGSVACLAREHDGAAQQLSDAIHVSIKWQTVSGILVHAIARLALKAHRADRLQSPAELDAYYVRRSDAELNWAE